MATFNTIERTNVVMGTDRDHKISGEGFTLAAVSTDLDIAVPLTITFTTPDDPNIYLADFTALAELNNPGKLEILEGPTVTVDTGSDLTPLNENRNKAAITSRIESIKTTPVANQATLGATITADGLTYYLSNFGIASQNNSQSAFVSVLKANTTYTIRLTTTIDNSVGKIGISWLEYPFH